MIRRRAVLAIVLAISTIGIMANGSADTRMTADRLLKQLQGPQAARYASSLYDDPENWAYVSNEIASGDVRWLQVATSLKQYSDAGFSEDLDTDLAMALARRPKDVLTMLQHQSGPNRFEAKFVCAAPIPSPGKVWLKRYRARTIQALRNVRAPKLRSLRDYCLQTLRKIDLTLPADQYR
jgi:hypothetical protein